MRKIRSVYVLFGISPRIWNGLRTYTEVPLYFETGPAFQRQDESGYYWSLVIYCEWLLHTHSHTHLSALRSSVALEIYGEEVSLAWIPKMCKDVALIFYKQWVTLDVCYSVSQGWLATVQASICTSSVIIWASSVRIVTFLTKPPTQIYL
jgi:hypothetical protein